jgi:hypothetical protein
MLAAMLAKRAMIELSPRYADRTSAHVDDVAAETVLPLYLALPLILLMSLSLWAGLWKLGAWIVVLLA